jgi:hypothetical protein
VRAELCTAGLVKVHDIIMDRIDTVLGQHGRAPTERHAVLKHRSDGSDLIFSAIVVVAVPLAVLLLGISLAWIIRGFSHINSNRT